MDHIDIKNKQVGETGGGTLGAKDAPSGLPGVTLVRGLANSGKTTFALDHIVEQVRGGADPASILLVGASQAAVEDLIAQLNVLMPGSGKDIRVMTARAFELEVLGRQDARAMTGREPRVMADWETKFLFEDMRTTTINGKRIKAILGFLLAGLTRMDDDTDRYIEAIDERIVYDALMKYLRAYGVYHECEVANACVHYLRECGLTAADLGIDHIIIDDYQCLNRASQLVFDLLGARELLVLGDAERRMSGTDPHPWVKGLTGFVEAHPGAKLIELAAPQGPRVTSAAAVLVTSGYTHEASPCTYEQTGKDLVPVTYGVQPVSEPIQDVNVRRFADPASELAGVADQVQALLQGGADPAQILITCPVAPWLGRMSSTLGKRGIPVSFLDEGRSVGGDLRDLDSSRSARLAAAFMLLADPDSALAWRVWVGFGDYLGASNIIGIFIDQAASRGVTLPELLRQCAADGIKVTNGQEHVVRMTLEGMRLMQETRGLTGRDLVQAAARFVGYDAAPRFFTRALELVELRAAGEAVTADSYGRELHDLLVAPSFRSAHAGVRLAFDRSTAGVKAAHVIMSGMMDGWLPPRAYFDLAEAGFDARRRMDLDARAMTYHLAAQATTNLTLTWWESCDLELAERMKLAHSRIRSTPDGRRATTTSLSVMARFAEHAWGLAASYPE